MSRNYVLILCTTVNDPGVTKTVEIPLVQEEGQNLDMLVEREAAFRQVFIVGGYGIRYIDRSEYYDRIGEPQIKLTKEPKEEKP